MGLPVFVSAWSLFNYSSASSRASETPTPYNSQTMALLESYKNFELHPSAVRTLAIVNDEALVSEGDISSVFIDAGKSGTGQISVYVVRKGDSLSTIARMFGVSVNTIVWANDLRGTTIKEGQRRLIISCAC